MKIKNNQHDEKGEIRQTTRAYVPYSGYCTDEVKKGKRPRQTGEIRNGQRREGKKKKTNKQDRLSHLT